MEKILLLAAALISAPAFAQYYNQSAQQNYNNGLYRSDQRVSGYSRSNGIYVEPYHRSAPDNNPYNNYSSQGNANPYTGQVGHKTPGY